MGQTDSIVTNNFSNDNIKTLTSKISILLHYNNNNIKQFTKT